MSSPLAWSLVLLVVASSACRTWEDVRDDARALRDEMAACSAGDPCLVARAPLNDCSGVLSCDFPVRSGRKAEAETRAAELAEESRGFGTCAQASCDGSKVKAVCDAATSRCVLQ